MSLTHMHSWGGQSGCPFAVECYSRVDIRFRRVLGVSFYLWSQSDDSVLYELTDALLISRGLYES